jgi:hypothetical protein
MTAIAAATCLSRACISSAAGLSGQARPLTAYADDIAKGARTVIDKATGKELTIDGRHDFFFIPMHYWGGAVLIALAALPFVLRR